MIDWLFSPIDPGRAHQLGAAVYWHGRLMVLAWCFLVPLGILAARYFKIMPGQDWPNKLDNPLWWHAHLVLQYAAGILLVVSIWIIWGQTSSNDDASLHRIFGWATIGLCSLQFLAGWLRGSKGGPTEIVRTGTVRGDHYDMTPRRRAFEYVHKSLGYICLLFAIVSVMMGLWLTNAPVWMWICLLIWLTVIVICFAVLQKLGRNFDTYQAIWGPDTDLPGNKVKSIGLGIHLSGKNEMRKPSNNN